MLENKSNILDAIKRLNGAISTDNFINTLVADFKQELVNQNDEKLVNMIFNQHPNQADLDEFLKNYDIEVAGSNKSLLLSYFMKAHPELTFNAYNAPRLKGLLNYYKFQNMKLIAHYKKICNELEKENIDVLIFKGGAMKHLRPELSRIMGDIDILVHEKDWKKAGKIAENLGYDCAWDIHSIDLHPKGTEEGIMDIHKYIHMQSGYEKNINDDLFARAVKTKVFGVNTLVPCYEDLFFIALVNMVRNLRNKTSIQGILYTLFDAKFLLDEKPDFNWEIVTENARKTKTEVQLCLAVHFINNIVPDLLPAKITEGKIFDKELNDYCTLLMYQRFFLWQMKQKGHELQIKDALTSWDKFIEYLKLKPKYFILKLFIFRKSPVLARMILKFNEKHKIGV